MLFIAGTRMFLILQYQTWFIKFWSIAKLSHSLSILFYIFFVVYFIVSHKPTYRSSVQLKNVWNHITFQVTKNVKQQNTHHVAGAELAKIKYRIGSVGNIVVSVEFSLFYDDYFVYVCVFHYVHCKPSSTLCYQNGGDEWPLTIQDWLNLALRKYIQYDVCVYARAAYDICECAIYIFLV